MSEKKVAVLDYGIGNVKSICNALRQIGATPFLTDEQEVILSCDALILPGVGAFAVGMKNLSERNLIPVLKEFVSTGKPFLGICLGMQMLLEESEEFGSTEGLGFIKGKVVKMPLLNGAEEKLPHVSWNELNEPSPGRWDGTLLGDTSPKTDSYFVHTYIARPDDEHDVLATAQYGGGDFCAAVHNKNVFGTQFHPEKSGEKGLKMLKKFIEYTN